MGGRHRTLVDTGAIFAMLDRRDRWHAEASRLFRELSKPFYTCESVISETCFLLESAGISNAKAFGLLNDGVVTLDFQLENEIERVGRLMKKYESVPMSVADACLVRMSERDKDSIVFTFDSDFDIYRKNRNQRIARLPQRHELCSTRVLM